MLEDAAYRRLLDVYYATEKPLPADSAKVCRLVRARSLAERKAVDAVLAEFFSLEPEGWRNKRADLEIAKANAKADKARESAAYRWQSERNANAMRTHSDGNAKAMLPITNSQEPINSKEVVRAVKNGAHHPAVDETPVLQTLPLIDGSEFEVKGSLVAELEPLYPKVDIPATVNEMKGWLIGHPERRKTRRGVKAFITKWLHNEQQKAA
jgi:uncharacterized protein YdaU (DUF1376 family)